MMTIDKFNFAGKKAIVRVDFNVPLNEEGKITDDTRIRGALPTLKKVLADGGALIIMSHMGKPKGKVNAKYSLSQIVDAVAAALGTPVQFAPDCAKAQEAAAALKPGEVLLLENLRFYPEEEGKPVGIEKEDPAYEDAKKAMKASQKEFAKTLASYADCYVMDAFGTAHRKHASTAVIADYFDADHKMLGYLMEKEVQAVDNVLKDIKRPFTAIMGGSKVSTKIGIIENLMDKVDNLILCGGMAFTFAKAQGGKIGNSLVEDDKLQLALDIIEKDLSFCRPHFRKRVGTTARHGGHTPGNVAIHARPMLSKHEAMGTRETAPQCPARRSVDRHACGENRHCSRLPAVLPARHVIAQRLNHCRNGAADFCGHKLLQSRAASHL